MTEIYLIRHTQAEGNIYRVIQGLWDGNVTENGVRQVQALAERFREVPIDALYSSDLYRTRFTASGITKYHDIEMNLRPALREVDMGDWEARFFGDIAVVDPMGVDAFTHDCDHWVAPGGESCAQVAARAMSEFNTIAEENDGKTVAVVSHGMTIRCILSSITGTPVREQPIVRNTAVNHLYYDHGKWTVDYVDDISHLSSIPTPPWQSLPVLSTADYIPFIDDDYYVGCYSEAWKCIHGSLRDFTPSVYLLAAHRHSKNDAHSVMKVYEDARPAGLIDLDTAHGKESGHGWISFLYLNPEYRFRGAGIQLLARAVMHYRALGRTALRLNVAPENTTAIQFYTKYGFRIVGEEPGCSGRLLVMEAEIERPRTLL